MENNGKIKVKNITPIQRTCWHERLMYQFGAVNSNNATKLVPASFINPDGECKFPFLKLVGFERDDGSLMEVKKVEEIKTISDAIVDLPQAIIPETPTATIVPSKPAKYIYKITKDDQTFIETSVKDLAEKIGVENSKLAQAFTTKKEKFEDWSLERFETKKFDLVDGLIVAKAEKSEE